MNLAVWDPFREMEELLERYGKSSKKALTKADESFEINDWTPVVDIYETEDNFMVKTELPGVENKGVKS